MIVKKRHSWVRMLFAVRGSAITKTLPRLAVIVAFSVVVTALEEIPGVDIYTLSITPFALVGVALGVFLGFRNNASYDRFWEGRKLWGALVNTTRSLARQTTNFIVNDDDSAKVTALQREIVRKTIGYVHALRHLLRDSDDTVDVEPFLTEEEMLRIAPHKNRPIFIIRLLGERIRWAWQQGWIDKFHLTILEGSLGSLTDIQGGCERIKNTPIPFAYSVLIHRMVAVYCFALPFGIVQELHVMTPVVVLFIAYAFLGLDEIGDEIEAPFDLEPQDLPLTALCRTIEINLLQHIDESDVPEFLEPVDDVLY